MIRITLLINHLNPDRDPIILPPLEVHRHQPIFARHVAQASPEVGGEGLLSCVFSHSGLQPRQGRDTKQRGRGRPTKGHTTSESQLAVEKRLSASGGAGVEDSGATPVTIYIYMDNMNKYSGISMNKYINGNKY